MALGRAVLSEQQANPALGHFQFGSKMFNAGAATRGPQKFPRVLRDNPDEKRASSLIWWSVI
jgi:hypothetical protein